jgi:adenine-specific DNA-methyltransferase
MPTLQFKGKNIIWNHHLSIPYHTLDEIEKLNFNEEKSNGNLMIEGDNLLALKALLPQYAGKVKCIFIDPPYNTGNEQWIYNDNVNNPMLKDWLGKEVGKDDLTRHDKWLCMIVPRLKLLRDLLSDDGAIFITIDDNEQHFLRQLMDEIFGEENYLGTIIWQHSVQGKGYEGKFSVHHNYIICYQKYNNFTLNLLDRTDEDNTHYSNPDNDPNGLWRNGDIRNALYRPNLIYDVSTPSGKTIKPPENGWRFSKETMQEKMKRKQVIFNKDETRLIFKIYLKDQKGRVPETIWFAKDSGTTRTASELLKELFDGKSPFDTPKPIELIKKIITLSCDNGCIILDSFAGSGTTMHAVMDLNKEDEGNRRCILIQMTEATESEPKKNICKDITRERIKRAIEKYGYESGFKYLKVGIPIDAETMLSGNLPTYKQFADYVYYLCTGESLKDKKGIDEKNNFVGEHSNSVIYLIYKQNFEELTRMALNLVVAEKIIAEHPKKRIVVYAPACFLEEDYMKEKNIEYVGIPYNLFQRSEA